MQNTYRRDRTLTIALQLPLSLFLHQHTFPDAIVRDIMFVQDCRSLRTLIGGISCRHLRSTQRDSGDLPIVLRFSQRSRISRSKTF